VKGRTATSGGQQRWECLPADRSGPGLGDGEERAAARGDHQTGSRPAGR